jgi:AraC-like DNA-binding protein
MDASFALRFQHDERWQHLAQPVLLQVLQSGDNTRPLEPATWLLLHCLRGGANCRWAGQQQVLHADQALLLERCDLPSLELEPEASALLFAFLGADATALELADALPAPLSLPAHSSIVTRLLAFRRMAGQGERRLSLVDGSVLVHSVLATLAHHADTGAQQGPQLVRQACALMQQGVEEAYDAEALASRLGVSPAYFCRAFTEAMRVSPGQYHKQLRLAHAARLLKGSRLSIQQITERIGYATQSAFARAFRSVYELSPQEYREHGSIPLA